MDLASLIGFISGLSLIISAILLGGDAHNFLSIPGLMIVLGGTIAATLLTFRFRHVIDAFKGAYIIFTKTDIHANDVVGTMVNLCYSSRREGLMMLGNVKSTSRFLVKACRLIADSSEEEIIRSTLRTEIDSLKMRHYIIQDVFRKMGTYSPAFGMLGTLIGLIQMLSNLQDASTVGPAMAVALLTTFYGSALATMFFLPIAGKLKIRTIREVINLEIMYEGAISILENNNPMLVYEKISSFIPSKDRLSLNELKAK